MPELLSDVLQDIAVILSLQQLPTSGADRWSSRAVKQNIKSNVNKVSGKEGPQLGHTAGTSIDGLLHNTTSVNQRIPILSTVWL